MGEIPGNSQLIIVGAGGHAMSVADAAISSGWTVIGFYSPEYSGPASALGPILTKLEAEHVSGNALTVGIGTNHIRESALDEITTRFPEVAIAAVIHKTAWVSPYSTVHPGATILAHSYVGPGSSVGWGALLNTGSSLDHESSLDNFASLGPGARTGGSVCVGKRTVVGMQASILHGISVGSDSVVGAHSLVNSDIGNNVVAWGVPAKGVRNRSREDAYY